MGRRQRGTRGTRGANCGCARAPPRAPPLPLFRQRLTGPVAAPHHAHPPTYGHVRAPSRDTRREALPRETSLVDALLLPLGRHVAAPLSNAQHRPCASPIGVPFMSQAYRRASCKKTRPPPPAVPTCSHPTRRAPHQHLAGCTRLLRTLPTVPTHSSGTQHECTGYLGIMHAARRHTYRHLSQTYTHTHSLTKKTRQHRQHHQ